MYLRDLNETFPDEYPPLDELPRHTLIMKSGQADEYGDDEWSYIETGEAYYWKYWDVCNGIDILNYELECGNSSVQGWYDGLKIDNADGWRFKFYNMAKKYLVRLDPADDSSPKEPGAPGDGEDGALAQGENPAGPDNLAKNGDSEASAGAMSEGPPAPPAAATPARDKDGFMNPLELGDSFDVEPLSDDDGPTPADERKI